MSDSASASSASAASPSAAPPDATDATARSHDPTSIPDSSAVQADAEASAAPKQPKPEDDDPEYELDGEKLKRSQLKEYRDIAKRQKDFERASHERMQKAAAQRKELEAREAELLAAANALRDNPWALHEKLGINADEIAEKRLLERMKAAQMSPEERAAQEARAKQEAELTELRKFREETEKKQKSEQQAQLQQQYREHFDKQIAEAITKANLPKTVRSAREVARVMAEYLAEGEQIDPVIAAQIVRNGYGKEISSETAELAKSNPQALIEMLGPEVVAAIVKSQIKQAQEFEPQKRKVPTPPTQPKPKEAPDFEEVRRKLWGQG